jgi:hypothetical protein
VEGLEKTNRSKKFNQEMTANKQKSLNQTVAYARESYQNYQPTNHNDSDSFLKQSCLNTIIDTFNATDTKKKINLTAFPTSPKLIADSFVS